MTCSLTVSASKGDVAAQAKESRLENNSIGGSVVANKTESSYIPNVKTIYDTAPLTIPVLLAGESCIIEIPWFPPDPADLGCFGADMGHVGSVGAGSGAGVAGFLGPDDDGVGDADAHGSRPP